MKKFQLAAAAVLICSSAFGRGIKLGDPRIIRNYPEIATSDCIGKPTTPDCAIDTAMACELRDDRELCHIVGTTSTMERAYPNSKGKSSGYNRMYIYHISGKKLLTAETVKAMKKEGVWRENDAAVLVYFADCAIPQSCHNNKAKTDRKTDIYGINCEPTDCSYPTIYGTKELEPDTYILRWDREEGKWVVVEKLINPVFSPEFWN